MKIYTRSGDRGKTSLFSGERVEKHHLRVETYGDADELNSVIGVVIAYLPDANKKIREELSVIQTNLLQIGAWLATTPQADVQSALAEITDDMVTGLEQAIDRLEARLTPLKNFILPGGHPSSAFAHVARTVCRRTERRVVQLALQEETSKTQSPLKTIQAYLNRLSDYLFVLARYCNKIHNHQDVLWK